MLRLILIFLVSTSVYAETTGRDLFNTVQALSGTPFCRKRLAELDDFKQVFDVEQIKPLMQGKQSPEFMEVMKTWSSDLLIRVILQLEQEYLFRCEEPKWLSLLAQTLKKIYLTKLGIGLERIPEEQMDFMFRALLVTKADFDGLSTRLAKYPTATPDDLVRVIYGQAPTTIRGVLFLGTEAEAATLSKWLDGTCGTVKECPFWDPKWIYRVLVTPTKGIALYVPETGVLLLSKEIFADFNTLHQMVVLHELTHVYEQAAWLVDRKRLSEAFGRLSGWKRSKLGKWELSEGEGLPIDDELTKSSAKSSFSLLPDFVYPARDAKKDGFGMAKTVRETKQQNDLSEDLADHVALFKLFPSRFCVQGRSIAPHKYEWIRKNLFPSSAALKCP